MLAMVWRSRPIGVAVTYYCKHFAPFICRQSQYSAGQVVYNNRHFVLQFYLVVTTLYFMSAQTAYLQLYALQCRRKLEMYHGFGMEKSCNNGLLVNVDKIEETIWNVFNEEENEHSDDDQIKTTERFECKVEKENISSNNKSISISCSKREGSDRRKRYKQYTGEDMQMALSYMEETG